MRERNTRQQNDKNCTNAMLSAWPKREFNLATEPGKPVMSCIVNDPEACQVKCIADAQGVIDNAFLKIMQHI